MSVRLRDHFITEFKKQIKMKEDISMNARSMMKMLHEAERVKIVNTFEIFHDFLN